MQTSRLTFPPPDQLWSNHRSAYFQMLHHGTETACEVTNDKTSLVAFEALPLCNFSGPHHVDGTLAETALLIHVGDKS